MSFPLRCELFPFWEDSSSFPVEKGHFQIHRYIYSDERRDRLRSTYSKRLPPPHVDPRSFHRVNRTPPPRLTCRMSSSGGGRWLRVTCGAVTQAAPSDKRLSPRATAGAQNTSLYTKAISLHSPSSPRGGSLTCALAAARSFPSTHSNDFVSLPFFSCPVRPVVPAPSLSSSCSHSLPLASSFLTSHPAVLGISESRVGGSAAHDDAK